VIPDGASLADACLPDQTIGPAHTPSQQRSGHHFPDSSSPAAIECTESGRRATTRTTYTHVAITRTSIQRMADGPNAVDEGVVPSGVIL
jgi:hypothetical protein